MKKPTVIWEPFPGSQKKFLTCPAWECLLHGNRGGGKGLLPDEKVLTPRGWTTMKKLKPGSVISNPDGTSQTVIQVFHRDKQQIYRIKTSDGTSIDCDGDHLWYSKIANRTKGKTDRNYTPLDFYGSVFRTEDLYKLLKIYPHKTPLVPCNDPIFYQQTWKSEINAYAIGLILGDGCITTRETRISTIDEETVDYLKSLGARIHYSNDRSIYSCNFSVNSKISLQIKELGLTGTNSGTKFIPKRLLQGSIEERTALLQGLMDSDGFVGVGGRCGYGTVSKKLAKDVRQLVLSLGGWATITTKIPAYTYKEKKKKGQLAYVLYIQFPNKEDLFRLKRKKERAKDNNYMHGRLVRKIVSIKKLKEKKKTICIVVNNPNRLFVTKGFLVTHNTDVLIMDFLQGVGKGYGSDYKGLLLREATTELGDVISKCKKWIPKIFPSAKYNGSKKIWTFEDGETLWLNYAKTLSDYDQYHGHEYPWIGWEELTNHPFPDVYLKLMSCNRSSNPKIPIKYRATCNPSGPGHQWVKMRFIDVSPPLKIHRDTVEVEFPDKNGILVKQILTVTRTHVQSYQSENRALAKADPLYMAKIYALTKDNEMLRKAWIDGSWDLIMGGFFTDVWDKNIHVIEKVDLLPSWDVLRSFDWGSSKPWCVTYGCETNGEQPKGSNLPYIPKGSVIIFNEVYGWTGNVNEGDQATSSEIANRVLSMDEMIQNKYKIKVSPGPADTSIWDVRDGTSIGNNLASHGCHWTRAYKGPGSRISGWSLIREMLGSAKRGDLESPHLYFVKDARHHIRTLPIMQRDDKKPEDIDTDLEDHPADSLRYLLARKMTKIKHKKVGV